MSELVLQNRSVPLLPSVLGYAGLLPFVFCAAAMWIAPPDVVLVLNRILLSYAACILAFMGAIHWGYAMHGSANSWQLGLSVLPSLLAWIALNLSLAWAYSLLIISFSVLCVLDGVASRASQLPRWYPKLRVPLTSIVVIMLIVGAFAAIEL